MTSNELAQWVSMMLEDRELWIAPDWSTTEMLEARVEKLLAAYREYVRRTDKPFDVAIYNSVLSQVGMNLRLHLRSALQELLPKEE